MTSSWQDGGDPGDDIFKSIPLDANIQMLCKLLLSMIISGITDDNQVSTGLDYEFYLNE